MKTFNFESSNLFSWAYYEESKTLIVGFKNETFYRYFNVPASVDMDVRKAESVGKFFNSVVRKGGFLYEKLAADEVLKHKGELENETDKTKC